MNFATLEDFDDVWSIFKENKEWFPHVWNTKIRKRIVDNELIFEDGVVITFSIYKRNIKIGTCAAKKGDWILHQIVAKERDGSAKKIIEEFFEFAGENVWLTVRENNTAANKFYKKVGMEQVGKISWAQGKMPGLVWKKNARNY